ncbi:MAG: TonB-dependent receptor [Rhodocyclaceae bacterium]|nr:MAG: TonB-dependent receptor [Rhodocyclaceae bacterium]
MKHQNRTDSPGAHCLSNECDHFPDFKLRPIPAAILLCLIATQVSAQTAPADTAKVESIVVTGTMIRGTAPVGATLIGVDRATMEKSGVATTSEMLRQVPQIINLGTDEGHTNGVQNANANITFGTGINLRGLGVDSTLTLVNGRRVVPNGSMGQFIDTSMIPALAIRRMEVVADGASATYGSDAVGGVVNILLREHYSGAETELRYGSGKDISGWNLGQLWGKVWDSGDVMLTFEHYERSHLKAADRAFYTDDMRPFGGPDLRTLNSNPGNIIIGTTRYAVPSNQNGVGLTPTRFTSNTANFQSAYAGGFDALPQQKRDSLVATFNQQLSERISLFGNGYYSKRDFVRDSTAVSSTLAVPRTNPFFACPATCATTVPVTYSFLSDFGAVHATGYETVENATVGMNVDLGGEWNGEVYTSYGHNHDLRLQRNLLNARQLTAALADANAATALNPFGAGSFTNPATLDKIRAQVTIQAQYKLSDSAVKADGPVASLPGGKMRLAVGLEYQDHQNTNEVRGSQTTPDNTTTSVVSSGDVKRTVQSAFVEAYVPIIGAPNAAPGVRELSLSLATRHDKYSDFGDATNPKVGLTWAPVNGMKLRSSYGTSFRAPSLADSDPSQGGTVSLVNFVDVTSPTGITRGLYRQGGNLGLTPEKATTWTLGAEFKPAPASLVSVTYFNVDYKDRILTPANTNAQSLVQAALLAPYITRNPSVAAVNALFASPYFTAIAENPANILVIVDGRKQNAGTAQTKGLDLAARYAFSNALGAWDAGVSGTYFFNFKQSQVPNAPLIGVLNTINNPLRFTARGDLGLTREAYSARLALNYANSYLNNLNATPVQVDSYTTADLLFSYDTGKTPVKMLGQGVRIALSIQNAFDRKPPYTQNLTLAFDPQVVSAIGRFVALNLSTKW